MVAVMGLSRGCEHEFMYILHGRYGSLACDANLARVSEHLGEAFNLFQDGADPLVIDRIA